MLGIDKWVNYYQTNWGVLKDEFWGFRCPNVKMPRWLGLRCNNEWLHQWGGHWKGCVLTVEQAESDDGVPGVGLRVEDQEPSGQCIEARHPGKIAKSQHETKAFCGDVHCRQDGRLEKKQVKESGHKKLQKAVESSSWLNGLGFLNFDIYSTFSTEKSSRANVCLVKYPSSESSDCNSNSLKLRVWSISLDIQVSKCNI